MKKVLFVISLAFSVVVLGVALAVAVGVWTWIPRLRGPGLYSAPITTVSTPADRRALVTSTRDWLVGHLGGGRVFETYLTTSSEVVASGLAIPGYAATTWTQSGVILRDSAPRLVRYDISTKGGSGANYMLDLRVRDLPYGAKSAGALTSEEKQTIYDAIRSFLRPTTVDGAYDDATLVRETRMDNLEGQLDAFFTPAGPGHGSDEDVSVDVTFGGGLAPVGAHVIVPAAP